MRLFCSTVHADGPRPPFETARPFGGSVGFDIWSLNLPVTQFLAEVRRHLLDGSVVSACVLEEPPVAGNEWVFFEWRGKLLIDLTLASSVLPEIGGWKEVGVHETLRIAIFEPVEVTDFAQLAMRYRGLLDRGEEGAVVLKRQSIETEDRYQELFGRYADPRIGGAIALLSLSGAAQSEAIEFSLRTPAALELEIDSSPDSLIAKPARDALAIRCVGFSNPHDLREADGFKTASNRWIDLWREASGVSPNQYFIAIELDASLDPTVAIRRGTVFEHQSLVSIQTLATARDQRTIVDVGEVRPLVLSAYCLNRELSPPHANPMRPTPFVYRRAAGTQGEVWRAREDI